MVKLFNIIKRYEYIRHESCVNETYNQKCNSEKKNIHFHLVKEN